MVVESASGAERDQLGKRGAVTLAGWSIIYSTRRLGSDRVRATSKPIQRCRKHAGADRLVEDGQCAKFGYFGRGLG